MEDRKIVDLSQRRAEDRRQRRKAELARFKPAPSMIVWAVLLVLAVVGYFWSGASTRFEKTSPPAASN